MVFINVLPDSLTNFAAETQYLYISSSATIWTNALGIIVAISIARLFRFLHRLYELARPQNAANKHKTPEAILWHRFLEWLEESNLGKIRLLFSSSSTRLRIRKEISKMAIVILLLISSFVAILTCGALTSRLATDGRALANHHACGTYIGAPPAPNISYLERGYPQYTFDVEAESAQYTHKCFHTEIGVDCCKFFLQQSIPFLMRTSNATCPFMDTTMCWANGSHVVHFSTGAVDARALVVNALRTLEFRRNATCSPVTMNGTFAKYQTLDDVLYYVYLYGPTSDHNYTHSSSTPVGNWRPNGYVVRWVLWFFKRFLGG